VEDRVDVVVLVDDHRREVPLAMLGQSERSPGAEIDDGIAVERVAIHTDHGLLVDRRRFAVVDECVDAAGVRLQVMHHPVGLGESEVVDVDDGCHGLIMAPGRDIAAPSGVSRAPIRSGDSRCGGAVSPSRDNG
jgi:hypothetical protein